MPNSGAALRDMLKFTAPAPTSFEHLVDGLASRRVGVRFPMIGRTLLIFDVPVEVLQFSGEWLHLRPADRTRLPLDDTRTYDSKVFYGW